MQHGNWATAAAVGTARVNVDATNDHRGGTTALAATVAAKPSTSKPRRAARRADRRSGAAARPSANGPTAEPSASGPSAKDGPTAKAKLRVLVSSADPFTRRAFDSGASAADIEVIARSDLSQAVETLAAETEPDIVVLDVQVMAATALHTIQQLHGQAPRARILACDAPANPEFGLLCLLAGAAGYMSKEADLAALPRILRALADGEIAIPRALATELAHRFVATSGRAQSPPRTLSGPESQVLELLRTGLTVSEIAAELDIRPATVQRHIGSARRKLSGHPTAHGAGEGSQSQISQSDDLEVP